MSTLTRFIILTSKYQVDLRPDLVFILFLICRIIERNNDKAPLTYKQFQRVIDGMDPPPKPVPTLTLQMLGSAVTPVGEDHDDKFGVPTLEELGFDCEQLKPPVWLGGESEALSR